MGDLMKSMDRHRFQSKAGLASFFPQGVSSTSFVIVCFWVVIDCYSLSLCVLFVVCCGLVWFMVWFRLSVDERLS